MPNNKLCFTNINYGVCCYCKNIVIAEHPSYQVGSWIYGCGLRKKEDGSFVRWGEGEFSAEKGCEEFEASGLPVHAKILERLINSNPLARNIPIDKNALETSYDFQNKMEKFPHIEGDFTDGSLILSE